MADFIDIVESSRWLIDRALSASDTDDFVKIETETQSITETAAAATPNDNILHALVNDEPYTSTNPYLSKSAEVELYLLATNFLVGIVCVVDCVAERFAFRLCIFRRPLNTARFWISLLYAPFVNTALRCHGDHHHDCCKGVLP
jgi:hypothetical protein